MAAALEKASVAAAIALGLSAKKKKIQRGQP